MRVDTKQVERCAEALGREIAAAERDGAFPSEGPPAPTMYLGLDGTGLPVRKSEAAGRAGKQPDGSAKTREAKLVVVWTAESRHPKTGRPQRDPGSASYSAAIESAASRDTDPQPSAFARRVRREAERRGFPQAQRRVVLGDGAAWIWRIAAEDYPGAIQIVDLFHVKEHLHEVSKELWPDDPDRARLWADVRCDELDDGCLGDVLAVLRSLACDCKKAAGCADYIEHNRERMQYKHFRDQGLCVGFRCRGVRLQEGPRHTSQTLRHALDGQRRQCHRRLALLHPQRTLRGLLGLPHQSLLTGSGTQLPENPPEIKLKSCTPEAAQPHLTQEPRFEFANARFPDGLTAAPCSGHLTQGAARSRPKGVAASGRITFAHRQPQLGQA